MAYQGFHSESVPRKIAIVSVGQDTDDADPPTYAYESASSAWPTAVINPQRYTYHPSKTTPGIPGDIILSRISFNPAFRAASAAADPAAALADAIVETSIQRKSTGSWKSESRMQPRGLYIRTQLSLRLGKPKPDSNPRSKRLHRLRSLKET